ncbi:alpha-1,3-mannosyl-glycoprotein 4-beta-N-acetylglucosaminyltransferase B-like [Latimeria chalumnae]|uniref:alpha-1,3-mannosyl-glycoprotein 4-beta-N-acetylglucosaminyltransferase B-like n=1 Tax=Latimeria chalumnae TaxID=7897 RepID=UPI00313B829E
MRLGNASVLTILVLATFLSVSWLTAWVSDRGDGVSAYYKEIVDLRQNLVAADKENKEQSKQLTQILNEIKRAIAEKRNTSQNLTDDMKLKFQNLTNKHLLHLTNVYLYLPHLLGNEESLKPNILLGQGRRDVSMVMGIPTVKREKESYLLNTIKSLFFAMSPEQKNDCIIIIFVAETDAQYVNKVTEDIKTTFPEEVQSGILEVISPPASYYPDLSNLKETFGDSKERVKWRTKQNLDYSFLMLYAQSKGTYYVQLEDDILALTDYFQTMIHFAEQQVSDDWLILEFSQLGFIGKLFRSSDLPMIVEFFLMFYKDKPVDWLLDHLLWVKVCNPEKDAKHCDRQKANLRIRYKPSLFQHIGTRSSLVGKIQNLKDKDFGKQVLHKAHNNPTAEVDTSLKVYQQYGLEKAYRGENFFWAFTPVAGDHITFRFFKPLNVKSYLFRSGNAEHPGDKVYNTTVEVLPVDKSVLLKDSIGNGDFLKNQETATRYLRIGEFVNGEAKGTIDPSIGSIEAIRLFFLAESPVWVLISEMHIKTT